jgi:putative hydrolase of the HAD superfamily
MRTSVAAVAFDLDGTLYPNYRLYVRLVPFILRELGLLRAFGEARNIIRRRQERGLPPECADFYEYQARLTAGILGTPPETVRANIERLIYRGWEPHFARIKLFAHAAETLEALRNRGFKLGLLSDFPPETKLAHLGIGGCWDAVLCSEQIGALKPDPRPFQELAAALNLAPGQILYVGNSRRYDVAGAKGAGMRTALITGPFSDSIGGGGAGSPDFVFHDYRQLHDYMLH